MSGGWDHVTLLKLQEDEGKTGIEENVALNLEKSVEHCFKKQSINERSVENGNQSRLFTGT